MKKSMSMKTQAFMMVFISMALLIVTTLITYQIFRSNALTLERETREAQTDNLCMQLQDWTQGVIESLQTISYSDQMTEFAQSDDHILYENKEILQMLMDLVLVNQDAVRNIRLCMKNGQSLKSSTGKNDYFDYQVYQGEIRTRLLSECISGAKAIVSDPYERYDEGYDTMIRRIYVLVPLQRKIYEGCYGALVASCSVDSYVQNIIPEEFNYAVYYKGKRMASNQTDMFADDYAAQDTLRDRDGVWRFADSAEGDWRVVLAYKNEINMRETLVMSWVYIALAAATHVALFLAIRRLLLRPLASIQHQVSKIQDERSDLTLRQAGANEIEYLMAALNDMIVRLQQANADRLQVQRERHEEQMQSVMQRIIILQTQINPHFLYNNLECIRGMAAASNQEAIRQITSKMAFIYRYCLKHDVQATMAEELACAQAYFEIIRLRYGDSYRLTIDVPQQQMNMMLPCMTLQPIIENAIKHGFSGKAHGTISVYVENDLLIVENDGCAMTDEAIAEVNRQLTDASIRNVIAIPEGKAHIGLINVSMRLKMLAGEEDGALFLRSRSGGGLTVVIRYRK